jgi:hypothetical protein
VIFFVVGSRQQRVRDTATAIADAQA